MRLILDEYGKGFNLIPDNNADKYFIRSLWERKTKNLKGGEKSFSINLYGHLIENHQAGYAPYQLNVNIYKSSSSAAEWSPSKPFQDLVGDSK